MRKCLLDSFSLLIYKNLHGDLRRNNKSVIDENVFDIKQGVCIGLSVKKSLRKSQYSSLNYIELYGKRETKYKALQGNRVDTIALDTLDSFEPYYFFVPKTFNNEAEYEKGFKLNILFTIYSVGIKTKVDHIATDISKTILSDRVNYILTNKLNHKHIREKYNLSNKTTWEYCPSKNVIFDNSKITKYEYRSFDYRYVYYDDDFLSRSRNRVMNNFFCRDNIGIESSRNGDHIFIGKHVSDEHFISGNSYRFPLYVFVDEDCQTNIFNSNIAKHHNFNKDIVSRIEQSLDMIFNPEIDNKETKIAPIELFDYIYAVLNSPNYREKYKEFLKIDFPRIPYPKDKDTFWKLVELGGQLRQIHLLESPIVEDYITTYPIEGGNQVEKVHYEEYRVKINKNQYFDGVPEVAWDFYIGGYQPTQKWLKDRKGRVLDEDDISHYQKIIKALVETDRIMKEIDKVTADWI